MTKFEFSTLIDQFDIFFLDSYGVIKNHSGLIEGVDKTIQKILDEGKIIRILTNDASRDASALTNSFEKLGLKYFQNEHIISSGMLAKLHLENKVNDGLIAYLGTESSAKYILDAGKEAISISKVSREIYNDITALVFLDDEGFDWNTDLNKAFNLLRFRNIPCIVANSDKVYPKSEHELNLGTGAIARMLETISGRTFMKFGKPDTQMFIYALESIDQYHQYSKSRILMVGDTLHTDILGGNRFGIRTALVLSGNTNEKEADLMIQSSSILPDFICRSI